MKTKAIEIFLGKKWNYDFEGTSESTSSLYIDPRSGHKISRKQGLDS